MKFNSPRDALLQLGLTGPATREDVKSAYRDLLKVYHPDAHPEPSVAWQYYDIVDAYEYLMATYDALEAGGGGGVLPEAYEKRAAGRPRQESFSAGPQEKASGERMTGSRQTASSGGRILGDAAAARENKQKTAWRAKSRKSESERRQEKLAELEERRQQAAFEDAMNRIHAERAAEVSAQIISAILRGDKPPEN